MKHKSEGLGPFCFITAGPFLCYILKRTASNRETQAKSLFYKIKNV